MSEILRALASINWEGFMYLSVLVLVSAGLGLLLTLPMFNLNRLGYYLRMLRQRQKTQLGKRARRPWLLSYTEHQSLHWGLLLLLIGINTCVMPGLIGFDNPWYWGAVFIVELLVILIYQQFRCRRFVDDAYAYLEMTAPGNECVDGLITDQDVPFEHRDAANWGRVIRVLVFEATSEGDVKPYHFFVTFPFEAFRRVRGIPPGELVRIFIRPRTFFRDLPEEVAGSVVGVQSIPSAGSAGPVDWRAYSASLAPKHR